MKYINNKKLAIILPLIIFLGVGITTYAVTIPNPLPGTFLDNFNRLTSLIRPFVILTFLGVFIWGGLQIQTSGPDSAQMEKGWKTIMGSVVGLLIIALGPSIVNLVGSLLGLPTLIDF
jgi:hypothetical protein